MPFEFKDTTDIDSVPEKYRGLYEETTDDNGDKKYAVGQQFSGIVGDYVGVNKALGDERSKSTKLKDENAKRRLANGAFTDLCESLGLEDDSRTADGLRAYIEEIAAQAKNGKELKVNLDKLRDEMNRKHAEELSKKDQEISRRDQALAKHLISDVATREIASAKGKVKVLLEHVTKACKVMQSEDGEYVVRILDGAGDVRYNGAAQPMTVRELVDEIKADPDFSGNFDSESPRGTGTPPGSTSRPSTQRRGSEMSSVDKIEAGLKKFGR